ncbi:TPA: translation initiation factor IF-2 [Candidatus Gastranaerophilales bacterium HUM_21]|nr:MAG TPA: translation initiation factor IF-2 [Candidatus Gastranaerophilales bacterium HUM_21]
MTDTIRVYDLAKELNLPNKDVIEMLDKKLGVKVKSHSSAVSELQAKKLKELVKEPKVEQAKKPKAFIVKKAKPKAEEAPKEEEKKTEPEVKPVEKVKLGKVEPTLPAPAPRLKLGKIEPVLPQRPPKQERPARPQSKDAVKKDVKTDRKPELKKEGAPSQRPEKKPIQRHIIPQEIYDSKNSSKKKGGKKQEKSYRSKEEEQERISLEKANAQKHKKRSHAEEAVEEIKSVVINQPLTVGELSEKINKASAEIVKFLMMQGILATVNQVIDVPTAKKVCENFEIEVQEEDLEAFIEEEMQKEEEAKELAAIDPKLLKRRAPVISIMGHVDHGKTTLLDSIRASKHKIVSTEVGGITQSIGAYTVYLNNKKIVFIDTPGHEAFTEMRARGAKATDIAILVVAADDGIMPQTIEAINHAKAAEVPIIVAVNKCDKPDANPDKIMQQLTEHGLVPEEWGGDTVCVKVSALQGQGIDELLEYILLIAEVQDLKANPDAPASGVVIEANLDKGKGPVATLLVQNGTLKTGQCVVVGNVCGKVRALLSDAGERVKKASPSTPVEILGLTEVPQAGDKFEVVENEKAMRAIVAERKEKERNSRLEAMLPTHIRNEVVGEGDDGFQHLNLIIKANTNGSAEALSQAIGQFKSNEIIIKLIHVGVGDISEADVMLAAASNAIILGFTVKEDNNAEIAAAREGVTIKKFDIIYQILEDLEKTMLSLLQPEIKEVELGKAEVRQVFTVGKTGRIAGCYVTEGKIFRNKTAKVVRNGEVIFTGTIDQLKRFKDDVKEVATGFECGISFAKFNDIQEGDIIEVSTTEEVERQALV